MRLKWGIIILLLILLGLVPILNSGISIAAQAYEIRDLSGIKIPDYSSPDLFPIEQAIEEIIAQTKEETADTPRNPQCVLMKWSDYIRYIDPKIGLPEQQLDRLIYVVTVDVIRRPWEGHVRFPAIVWEKIEKGDIETIEHFTSRQDIYFFDAKTGEALGFGYNPFVIILPKQ
ncbi:MAG: hypothetical protein QMD88_09070 [Coprothermobacterota bacterium]|nr:hypothetical protein [Coprothermobacterota bacterium]